MNIDPDYIHRRVVETRAAQGLPAEVPEHRRDAIAQLFAAGLRTAAYQRERDAA